MIIWAEHLLSFINIVIYTVSTLFGTAILTVIYKGIDPAALPQD